MWCLIVWQLSFSDPMVKTRLQTEEDCLRLGASFEVSYRDTARPIEFKCMKMGE